jgi:hypothetical protein
VTEKHHLRTTDATIAQRAVSGAHQLEAHTQQEEKEVRRRTGFFSRLAIFSMEFMSHVK